MPINDIFNQINALFIPQLADYVRAITRNVALLAGVITTVHIGYKVVRTLLGATDKFEASTIVRPSLILAAIVLYIPLVNLLIDTPTKIIDSIILDGLNSQIGIGSSTALIDAASDKLEFTQDTDSGGGNGIFDILQVNPFLELFHLIVFFIANVVGGYVLFTQVIMKAVYYLLGPLALALSLIPGNDKVVENWFQGIFSVYLWLPVLNLIQGIIIILPVNQPGAELDISDILFTMVFQIAMIFTVLKVPQFASFLVVQGSQLGNQLGSNIGYTIKGAAINKTTNVLTGGKSSGGANFRPPSQR